MMKHSAAIFSILLRLVDLCEHSGLAAGPLNEAGQLQLQGLISGETCGLMAAA